MNTYMDLADRTEFTTKEGTFVEEFLCVECPECGQQTIRIVTGSDLTYYVHGGDRYCKVTRGTEFVDDAIIYYQSRQGDHSEVNISSAVQCW